MIVFICSIINVICIFVLAKLNDDLIEQNERVIRNNIDLLAENFELRKQLNEILYKEEN